MKNVYNFKDKLIIGLFIASLIIFLSVLYLNFIIVLEKKEIITTVIVGDKSGFDLNKTALTFGMITPGSSSQRNLVIENNYNFPVKVELRVGGDIKRFLVFKKIIYLDVGEKKTIGINAIASIDEKSGDYYGKMIFITKVDINIFNKS